MSASFATETEQTSGASTDLIVIETSGGLKRKVKLGNVATMIGSSPSSSGAGVVTWSSAQTLIANATYELTHPPVTSGRHHPIAILPQPTLQASLLHFNSDITDSSPSARTWTLRGDALTHPPQQFGNGATFNGSNTIDTPSFSIVGGDFTIEGWVVVTSMPDANGTIYGLVCQDEGAGVTNKWFIRLEKVSDSTALMRWFNYQASGPVSVNIGSSTFTVTDTRHHFAVVRIGNTTKLYWDGVEVGTGSDTARPAPTAVVSVGGYQPAFDGVESLIGTLDEIQMVTYARYSSAFTPPTSAFGTAQSTGYSPMRATSFGSSPSAGVIGVQTLNATTTIFKNLTNATVTNIIFGVRPE